MAAYYSISYFRDNLNKMIKKPKDGYTNVVIEICNDFKNKTIEEIRINNDMILNENEYTIIKLRLPDSKRKLSKSEGYRLIYYVHKQKDEIVFLYIYPKRGTMGMVSISGDFMKELIKTFLEESHSKSLVEHDIQNKLIEIKAIVERNTSNIE